MTRSVLTVVLQALLGTLLTLLLAGAAFLVLGLSPAEAFIDQGIRSVLGFVDIGIVTWVVLLVVGAVRRKGIGHGVSGSVLAALVGAVVNLVWIVILSAIGGGVDPVAIMLGVQAGLFFLLAVAITAPLVLRVLIRTTRG